MDYIERTISSAIREAVPYYSVIAVAGPRQVGKTTLCQHLFPDYEYINLENISLRELIESDIQAFLNTHSGNLIIDEIQHIPSLLSYLQVSVDANPDRHFVLTGSSNFSLLHTLTQSLAGRVALFTLLPLSMEELPSYAQTTSTDQILLNGFYPAFFARHTPPKLLYRNYYNTYVERDVHQLMNIRNLSLFQKFIRLCAGRVGSECNFSALANETGVSAPSIKEWVSILEASYVVWHLSPYYANINKRLVKSPKLYFYDTGLLCYLLGIEDAAQLATHPLRGAVFENMVVSEMLKRRCNLGLDSNLYYYRENKGNEVDLLALHGNRMALYEVKSAQTFNKQFLSGLRHLEALFPDQVAASSVIYDGAEEIRTPLHSLYNFRNIPSCS